MGVTGVVRSIFFRNKSFGAHYYRNKSFEGRRSIAGDKKRWSSVRSYLCGDEFNSLLAVDDSDALLQQLSSDLVIPCDSVLAIQDSASLEHFGKEDESVSVRSSEATVTQPLHEENSRPLNNSYVKDHVDDSQSEAIPKKHHTNIPIEQDDAAAVTIQTDFRSYLAIRLSKQVEQTFVKEEGFSSGKVSMWTSLQVQTCNSVKAPFYRRKQASPNQRTQHKNKTQVLRLKEDWDDSTVSSTISRLRIESRMEAMTKRERALAYAFSQQLRICSKKKQIDQSSKDESNIGWSWLERWMATRVPRNQSDKCCNKKPKIGGNKEYTYTFWCNWRVGELCFERYTSPI